MAENNAQLKADIEEFVDRVWPEVLDDIEALVGHDSVEDLEHAAEGAPWGPGPRAALDEALCIANVCGLEAHDCEGYLGYADLVGESEKQIATIAHVDVVPAGPGWHTDPFEMVRRDGWLLGRGVIDDKGPAVLSLYAGRFFAERVAATGKRLPYTLRVILGVNEETNMGDVEYYLALRRDLPLRAHLRFRRGFRDSRDRGRQRHQRHSEPCRSHRPRGRCHAARRG